MKKKLLWLLALVIFANTAFAFDHGGNANHPALPTPVTGDVYVFIASGASYVTRSNVVNVDTLRILDITTNKIVIFPGDSISVTMTVRNTGLAAHTVSVAALRMYRREFSLINPLINTPNDFLVSAVNIFYGFSQNPGLSVPPGTVATFNFAITVTTNVAAFNSVAANPLVLDGLIIGGTPPDDHYWNNPALFNGFFQYAADVTANWDTSGLPFVASVQVSPNPARATLVTVTVNFSEWMNTTQAPSINFQVNGNTFNITNGFWASNSSWVGTYNIPAGQSALYDGIATLMAVAATDNAGFAMLPSYNIGTFEIDTTIPTASLVMGLSANVGLNFPITLVATDILQPTPTVVLHISGNITSTASFTAQLGGITWNGFVFIPPAALASVGSIATFDVPVGYEYMDDAGNTNNVLTGRVTVSIAEAVPVIITVNFDSVEAFNGMTISSEPNISVFVIDYKVAGLDPNTVRVSVDNVLAFSGPVTFYQVAATPYRIYRFDFTLNSELGLGVHHFDFGLSDLNGFAAPQFSVDVNVFSSGFELVRDPIPFPNPFSPNGDGIRDVTYIVYNLSKNTDVWVYIYDLNGDIVWKRFIASGLEGAHAGVNKVMWDGTASFSGGGTLPNGIYICHIVIEKDGEKKSLGRTKIFLLN